MRFGIGLTGLLAAICLGGCEEMGFGPMDGQPAPFRSPPARHPPARADYMAAEAVRAGDSAPVGGAVDAALEWSGKYAKAAEELLESQKANKQLREANGQLTTQLADQKKRLDRAQKELGEANEMLLELGKELRAWKGNVLGFRSEMQQAQQVQMDAIKKILVLLGGELGKPRAEATPRQAASAKDATSDSSDTPSG